MHTFHDAPPGHPTWFSLPATSVLEDVLVYYQDLEANPPDEFVRYDTVSTPPKRQKRYQQIIPALRIPCTGIQIRAGRLHFRGMHRWSARLPQWPSLVLPTGLLESHVAVGDEHLLGHRQRPVQDTYRQ